MKHIKHKKLSNPDSENLYLLKDSNTSKSYSLDVAEDYENSTSLQVPKRQSRKRRSSSISRDFGQMFLSWSNLSASIEITVSNKKWQTPFCCLSSPVKDRKVILEGISGIALHGELSFLLGHSGAGKTTLLTVLCNRYNNPTLEVMGRIELQGSPARYTIDSVAGYVPQFSYQLECLTVWEHVWFHATLRAFDCHNAVEVEAKVNSILKKLDLLHISNSRIGSYACGISGGEKKRLSLATELLADPPVLFIDEPTSGLDSTSAYSVMKLFKDLAKDGRAVIVSIHQPSSAIFDLCDRLTVLHEGKTIYHGPTSSITTFLDHINSACPQYYNITEHLLNLAQRKKNNKVEQMKRYFQQKNEITEIGKPVLSSSDRILGITSLIDALAISGSYTNRQITWFTQLRCVLWRSFIYTKRNPVLGRGRAIQSTFTALSLAICFFQLPDNDEGAVSKVGALAIALLAHTMVLAFLFMRICVTNKQIYNLEKKLKMYPVGILWVAQNISELPTCMIISLTYSTFIYFTIGLELSMVKYLITVAAFMMCVISAMGYGLLVASIADTFTTAQLINMVCLFTILFVGGPFSNAKAVPVYIQWVQYLSWLYQAHEISVIVQFDIDWKPKVNVR